MSAIGEDKVKVSKSAYEQMLALSLEAFREGTDTKDLPIQTLLMFLAVSENGKHTVEELRKRVPELSTAAVSRNLSILCGTSVVRKDGGLDLCEYEEDPMDRRYKLIKLTKKGKDLREKMFARSTRWINEAV